MAIGKASSYDAKIVSGTSSSAAIDLGRGYSKVVFIPTAASGAVMFQVAPTLTGTYSTLKYPVSSGMSAPQTVTVGSAVSGHAVEISALAGHQFIKVVTDNTFTNGVTLKLICSDA